VKNLALRRLQRDEATVPERMNQAATMAQGHLPACCSRSGWVYLIEGLDLIKIGAAEHDLATRLRGLQYASPAPLRLLAVGRGGQAIEHVFHVAFASSRRHGEWFTGARIAAWLHDQPDDRCISCSVLATIALPC
jgi:hypothetical protein